MIERPEPWLGDGEQDFQVDIQLSDDIDIEMDMHLAHEENGQLGFVCRHISLESIQRLRRLIELNLADPQELERELGALIEV
ncbi:Cyclic diguanosine monophosphate-binding protein [compost metagenome]